MSNIDFIFPEKTADIGNFLVGRLLPFRQKRNIGPFVFIDHMGPATLSKGENLEVGPHPHIGLSTLTFLFEGAIMHRDSIGNEIVIEPGAVNWMTAGKGVAHSERTPDYLKEKEKKLHGLQIWVALPKELEQCEPSFYHIDAEDLPAWEENGVKYKLIAGEVLGKKSPVPVHSPLYLIELVVEQPTSFNFENKLFGESGLYVLEGGIAHQEQEFGEKQILITKEAHLCSFEVRQPSKIYLFGGEPFEEERFIFWNFVSSSKETIDKAKEDWKNHRFAKVKNDDDYVPLPEPRL